MSIDINTETLVPLASGRKLPGSPARKLLESWGTLGIKGKSGRRIVLDVVKIGGSAYTSQEAFKRFSEETTADSVYDVEA